MSLCSYSSDTHSGSFMVIESAFINDYLPQAPDTCVKVYLYGLHLCSSPTSSLNSLENLMHTLSLTAGEVKDAFLYWQGEGLVQLLENTSTNEISIKYLPIHKKLGGSKKFANKYADFNGKAQALISSRMIAPSEYNEYYTLLESFHFDQDALIGIIDYCVKLKGSRVGYPYIVAVARDFANNGFISTEAVQERLNSHGEVNDEVLNILKVFKSTTKYSTIEDRTLYIKWAKEFGFAHGVIKEVAKQIRAKNGNMQKLDKALTTYYNSNVMTIKEIENFNEAHDANIKLARELTRLLGTYYENLDIVIETYIIDWQRKGYDEETLKMLATYCFKRAIKTLEGMNTCINKFYKLGLISNASINQYMEEIVSADNKIQAILDNCNILRNVNSFDRDTYHTWTATWGISDEIITLVSTYAKDKSQPIQYMNKILANLYDSKITSYEEAKTHLESFGETSKKSSKTTKKSVANFTQREYDKKDLDALFDSLDNFTKLDNIEI